MNTTVILFAVFSGDHTIALLKIPIYSCRAIFRYSLDKDPSDFTKQLRKTAGSGVSDCLRDLSDRQVGLGEKVFGLTHSSLKDVLGDSAVMELFGRGFQFRSSHCGNLRKTL